MCHPSKALCCRRGVNRRSLFPRVPYSSVSAIARNALAHEPKRSPALSDATPRGQPPQETTSKPQLDPL